MGRIILRSSREIELMRRAGRLVHETLEAMREMIEPGVTTGQLEELARSMIEAVGAEPLFFGVPNPGAGKPFPACTCISVNEEVVHGIPGPRKLEAGDVVSIDCGVRLSGYCGDSATTVPVNGVSREVSELLAVTRECLQIAVEEARPGVRWSRIAGWMEEYAKQAGFSVVRKYVGHGIGTSMHEEPKVPNYVSRQLRRNDFELRPGTVLAVEPMISMGRPAVVTGKDGWTVMTKDRKPAAHFEHMIAITRDGCDVLTDGR